MLIHFIRWLQGYLKIQIIGYSPERFLNLCKYKNMPVWGLLPKKDSYELYISLSDFRKIKPICKKTQMKVKIMERLGLPFYIYGFRKRKIFFAGMILSILAVYAMSFFIWKIEITGNQRLTDDILFSYFDSKSIYHGMAKNRVNCEQIVTDLRQSFEEIIWVSASINGTELLIEVKENTDSSVVSREEGEPTDIVATKNGIIVKMITRNGVPKVSVGQEVAAGDLLVAGSIDVMNDSGEVASKTYVTSDAEIWAETTITYQDEINTSYKEKKYSEEVKYLLNLKLRNQVLSIGESKNRNRFREYHTEEHCLKLGNHFYLPCSIETIKIKEYELEEATYTRAEREDILNAHFERYCRELEEQNVVILENELRITHNNDKSIATSTIKVQQNIGESRKIIDLSSGTMVQ